VPTEVFAVNTFHTIFMSEDFAKAAKLLAEPARAAIVLKLMGGRSVPAGELAVAAHVSPQTASEHLARLTQAGFVTVHRQGRHRYYELSNEEVAHAVESLMVLSSKSRTQSTVPTLGTIQYARTCYAHLAGWLGVAIADALQRKGYLAPMRGRAFVVTDKGREWFEKLEIALPSSSNASDSETARPCPDWTERRPHVAGPLGIALYKRFSELGWIAPTRKSRIVRVTLEGREALLKHLGIVAG
jgi:DNA-binding transcriptional ArsR family regulator